MTVRMHKVARIEIVKPYCAGATLRQVAKRAGLSHETVRRRLIQAGVKLRQRRMFPGGRVGSELLADLAEKFPNGASVPELIEWLGEDRQKVLRAVTSLLKHGYVVVAPRTDG